MQKNAFGKITRLRKAIDRETKKMLLALSRRTMAARKIGEIKANEGLPVRDSAREKQVLADAGNFAEKIGLSKNAAKKLAIFCIKQAYSEEENAAKSNVIKSKKTRR